MISADEARARDLNFFRGIIVATLPTLLLVAGFFLLLAQCGATR